MTADARTETLEAGDGSDELDGALAPYDFALPAGCIAQEAIEPRDAARLLVATSGEAPEHAQIRDLPRLLQAGDLLVVNTTRVVAARLRGVKQTGGAAEALILGVEPDDPTGTRFRALVKCRGRLRIGLKFDFYAQTPSREVVHAEVHALLEEGVVGLAFAPGESPYSVGEAPLPPYIRRPQPHASDLERYQTVYARVPGAVAAPTAGLHLTRPLLEALSRAGIETAEVVLHVGEGTFRPLRARDLALGRLHAEPYVLPESTARAVAETRRRGGRVVAVGTTTARVLEACADCDGSLQPGEGETDLFLRPGARRFRVVDRLLTNFHLPRSSLLMLVAAFAGRERVLALYRQAIETGYRFYSYGDATLLDREPGSESA